MSSVNTVLSSIKKLLSESATNTYWFILAKPTSWANEEFPPIPSANFLYLPEATHFVYSHLNKLVYPNLNGEVYTKKGKFSYIDNSTKPSILTKLGAVYLLNKATLRNYNFPSGFSYRSLGLATNVKFKSSVESIKLTEGTIIEASNVLSYDLEWVACFKKIEPQIYQEHSLEIMRRL